MDETVPEGSIALSLRCHILASLGWGVIPSYHHEGTDWPDRYEVVEIKSLISVDLSGCTNLRAIEDYTFAKFSSLASVLFNENLESIGVAAFFECESLKKIILPQKLTVVEEATFSDCHSLSTVVFHDNITNIGKESFTSCPLSSIRFPDKLTSIGELAFCVCDFEELVFNDDLETIGDGAFANCSVKCVTLPDKLTTLERYIFSECDKLERVYCNKHLTSIGRSCFIWCFELKYFQLASSSVSLVGDLQFRGCGILIERATAAGFPSSEWTHFQGNNDFSDDHTEGDGVPPYLIDRFEENEKKRYVLLANLRFVKAVDAAAESEEEKIEAAKLITLDQRHFPFRCASLVERSPSR